jgi:hypothetical protein
VKERVGLSGLVITGLYTRQHSPAIACSLGLHVLAKDLYHLLWGCGEDQCCFAGLLVLSSPAAEGSLRFSLLLVRPGCGVITWPFFSLWVGWLARAVKKVSLVCRTSSCRPEVGWLGWSYGTGGARLLPVPPSQHCPGTCWKGAGQKRWFVS